MRKLIVMFALMAVLVMAALAGTFSDGDAYAKQPVANYQYISDGGGCVTGSVREEKTIWFQGGSIHVDVYYCNQNGNWQYLYSYWQVG